jgi:hypothetical protein
MDKKVLLLYKSCINLISMIPTYGHVGNQSSRKVRRNIDVKTKYLLIDRY